MVTLCKNREFLSPLRIWREAIKIWNCPRQLSLSRGNDEHMIYVNRNGHLIYIHDIKKVIHHNCTANCLSCMMEKWTKEQVQASLCSYRSYLNKSLYYWLKSLAAPSLFQVQVYTNIWDLRNGLMVRYMFSSKLNICKHYDLHVSVMGSWQDLLTIRIRVRDCIRYLA
jgi:hypothetical protein